MPNNSQKITISSGQEAHSNDIKFLRDICHALDKSSIVAFTDVRGDITYVNDKFCEISDYSRDELLGQNHRILNSGIHSKEFFRDLWRTISRGQIWQGEIVNRSKTGRLYWVETTIVPFLKEGRPYQYCAIRNDITEKKNQEEQLQSHKAQMIYSEKMASLGEISAGITHELGNPLSAIRGRIEMLQFALENKSLSDAQLQKTSATVIQLIDRMSRIIRGMKNFARDGSQDEFEKTRLDHLFNEVREFSQHKMMKHNVSLDIGLQDESLWIQCRETEILQVLVNLLNNSRDAIEQLKERWIKLTAEKTCIDDAEWVVFKVTDSGTGVSKEIEEKIFNPFYSTKKLNHGTGLGLSITKSIVEGHGGEIFLDSDSPHTCFVIRLPKVQYDASEAEQNGR